jgi:uncharacterized protein (DUF697 family)
MVTAVAYVAGRDLSLETAKEFLLAMGVNVGSAFALREIARGLVKLIPGYANVISGGVAAVGTQALGEAAIVYFIDDKTIDEAKDAMRLASKKS